MYEFSFLEKVTWQPSCLGNYEFVLKKSELLLTKAYREILFLFVLFCFVLFCFFFFDSSKLVRPVKNYTLFFFSSTAQRLLE